MFRDRGLFATDGSQDRRMFAIEGSQDRRKFEIKERRDEGCLQQKAVKTQSTKKIAKTGKMF